MPRGAFTPNECLTNRFQDVLAAKRLRNDGVRSPNFTTALPARMLRNCTRDFSFPLSISVSEAQTSAKVAQQFARTRLRGDGAERSQ